MKMPPLDFEGISATAVISICGALIALASLFVAAHSARATRIHNRLSFRPILALRTSFRANDRAGLHLANIGLGPAVIVKTVLVFDGNVRGEFNEEHVNKVRELFLRGGP